MISAPEFDHAQARREGWDIFDNMEIRPDRYQLQAIDDPTDLWAAGEAPSTRAAFANDDAAWAYVAAKVREGSPYHCATMAYLREWSRLEYDRIVKTCGLSSICQ